MINKLRTLLWFLQRPTLYPHLAHLMSKKLSPSRSKHDNTRQEAEDWCASLAIDTQTALEQLTGHSKTTPIDHKFSNYFADAENIAKNCPIKMGGAGDLDLLYWSAEHLKATKVIETGVAYGWSSMSILLSLKQRQDAKLISTDMPYPNLNNDSYVGCVVPADVRPHWSLVRSPDRQALPQALNVLDTIDMCHYDSDKSYEGRMWAYPELWKSLRPGGFFISDDIGDNIAFCDFSKKVGCDPIIVEKEGKYIGVMVKPVDREATRLNEKIH